jgi:two-component SAPR family response regulator
MNENSKNSLLISLVIDDWEKLERLEFHLQDEHRILPSPFGAHGLEVLQDQKPDLVIVDLVFENMTDKDFQTSVRSISGFENLPLVFMPKEASHTAEPKSAFDVLLPEGLMIENFRELVRNVERELLVNHKGL